MLPVVLQLRLSMRGLLGLLRLVQLAHLRLDLRRCGGVKVHTQGPLDLDG